MSRIQTFRLPDLGEGLTEGEVLQWLVQPGDRITLNQPIVEVETAKAAVEVPSPFAGVVTELHAAAGETVDVGAPLVSVETAGEATAEPARGESNGGRARAADRAERGGAPGAAATTLEAPSGREGEDPVGGEVGGEAGLIGGPAPGGRTSVLVGYGPREPGAARRRRRSAPDGRGAPDTASLVSAASTSGTLSPEAVQRRAPARVSAAAVADALAVRATRSGALAKPPVRKLARDLGVNLADLAGTGPGGIVTRADVEAAGFVGATVGLPEATVSTLASPAPTRAAGPAERRGERRVPIRGVRKLTAEHMVASAFTAPHVTEFVTVDVSETMHVLRTLAELPEFAGVKLSPLAIVARALVLAVRRHPEVNSTWDGAAGEIIVKDYVNLGIAAATPRGLIVPNIKDADLLDLASLARALTDLVATARAGRTSPAEMAGGTITITNVGVFGVDTGTPILNPGESAILCLGMIREAPWVVDGQLAVRWVTQLGLSFDHRVVDGALGSRFLADIAAMLRTPELMLARS